MVHFQLTGYTNYEQELQLRDESNISLQRKENQARWFQIF
jgi:hypothetical protein